MSELERVVPGVVKIILYKHHATMMRVPAEVWAALHCTKVLAARVAHDPEPSDDELRDMWDIIKKHV